MSRHPTSPAGGGGGAGNPGGDNTQVQFNDAAALGGDSAWLWNKTTNFMTLTGRARFNGAGSVGDGVARVQIIDSALTTQFEAGGAWCEPGAQPGLLVAGNNSGNNQAHAVILLACAGGTGVGGDAVGCYPLTFTSAGTFTSPVAIGVGVPYSAYGTCAYDGAAFPLCGEWQFYAAQNYTPTAHGTGFRVNLCGLNGSEMFKPSFGVERDKGAFVNDQVTPGPSITFVTHGSVLDAAVYDSNTGLGRNRSGGAPVLDTVGLWTAGAIGLWQNATQNVIAAKAESTNTGRARLILADVATLAPFEVGGPWEEDISQLYIVPQAGYPAVMSWVSASQYGSQFRTRQSRGTYASPTPTQNTDSLWYHRIQGWAVNGDDGNRTGCEIYVRASQTWQSGKSGSYYTIKLAAAETDSLTDALQLYNNSVMLPQSGSNSLPDLNSLGDSNTGLRWLGSDVLSFVTAATQQWTIDANGDLNPTAGNKINYNLATIADADGTLADITTKFNTLLARLETIGLLAAA